MNPIIRSAERAAYILDVSPQAFEKRDLEFQGSLKSD